MPLALAEYAMDFARSSVCVNAATVLISGLGAPARTAMPMLDCTRSTRLPATTLPCLISCRARGPT